MQKQTRKIIPLVDARTQAFSIPTIENAAAIFTDTLGRELKDLRISVTDRCNFRCTYCMPKEIFNSEHQWLRHSELLSFEEIKKIARIAANNGVEKIRLTGGEPLLRKGIENLIAGLSEIQSKNGKPISIAMTTNGSLLTQKASLLKKAGLSRITVSLDSLNDETFRAMNDVNFPVQKVLDGIKAAQDAGLTPVKVNMVVKRGVNEDQILPMTEHFYKSGVILRFIEYMDVGSTNGWQMNQVVTADEIINKIKTKYKLAPLSANTSGETALRYGFLNEKGKHDKSLGEVGAIASVTKAFCGQCNRARLSMEGKIFLCLFAAKGYDLREIIRQNKNSEEIDKEIQNALSQIWQNRKDRYSEIRGQLSKEQRDNTPRVEMHYIGG